MRRLRSFLIGLIAVAALHAQDPTPALKIGAAAPPVAGLKVVQGPPEAASLLPSLAGRVTVLEFWATWCAPCVAAISHLNALVEKFESQGVVFVSVSDEPGATQRSFLERHPIRGWVTQDENQRVARAYRLGGIPMTVIVDKNARIAGIAYPDQITEEVLERALKGESSGLPPWENYGILPGADPGAPASSKPPLLRVEIRYGDNPHRGGIATSKGRFTADTLDTTTLLINAFQISPSRILNRELLPSWYYTVVASVPEGQENLLWPLLQQAVPAALEVSIVREEREMDVFLLRAPHGPGPGLRKASGGGVHSSSRPGLIVAQNEPISGLANSLELTLQRPVVDETSLEGNWDWEVSYTAGDTAALEQALKALGLELVPARRKVPVLVIQKPAC